ncbi:hypothetical protein [Kitasatospora sp. NPDC059160]
MIGLGSIGVDLIRLVGALRLPWRSGLARLTGLVSLRRPPG